MAPARSLALLILAATAAACAEPGAGPAAPVAGEVGATQAHAPEEPDPLPPVVTLAGHWRVAAIDGRSFDEPAALTLTGDAQTLWWEPTCAGMVRSYRIERSSVSFEEPRSSGPAGSERPPVCHIGLAPRLPEVMRALDNAVRISRTENNGILVSGPDHSVVLFSQ